MIIQQEGDDGLSQCLLNDKFAPFSLQSQKPFLELLQAPGTNPALARHVGAWSGTLPARPPFAPEQAVRLVVFPTGRVQYVREDLAPGRDANSYFSTQPAPDGGLQWSSSPFQYTLTPTNDPNQAQFALTAAASSATATLARCSVAQADAAPSQQQQPHPTATPAPLTYFENRGQPWTKIPAVVIAGDLNNPRITMVRAAIDYWNGELSAIGSGFRVGSVEAVVEPLPGEALVQRSESILGGQRVPELPDLSVSIPGDMIVALSDANFVSYGGLPGINTRVFVGIGGNQSPRSLPNVMPNVITHEIGHAIGLGHNSDPTLLMCGRPASCRPDDFRSAEPRLFPITDEERATLLRLYPADWQPSR